MSRDSQTITLKDGRVLGFAEYGDPKGKPLFYFHGWPASRLSAEKYDLLGRKLHIRIFAPDRPGYGLSDFQPDRTLLNWSDDVVALADHLKIKKFAVMGASGGGPYAAVCAYKIPQRLTRVGIVVGLGPTYIPGILDGTMWIAKIGWVYYGHASIRKTAAIIQLLNARYGSWLGLDRFLFRAKKDTAMTRDPSLRRVLRLTLREAFRVGLRGPAYDLKLYSTDWGFKVGDIKTLTYLWYGEDDRNVSLAMARYYTSQILNSKLTVYPGEGHLVSVTHAGEILKTLTS